MSSSKSHSHRSMSESVPMIAKTDRLQRLSDEYDDLAEEYQDCGNHDERCRCATRMDAIIKEMTCEARPVLP